MNNTALSLDDTCTLRNCPGTQNDQWITQPVGRANVTGSLVVLGHLPWTYPESRA